jgi:hypothetical protein
MVRASVQAEMYCRLAAIFCELHADNLCISAETFSLMKVVWNMWLEEVITMLPHTGRRLHTCLFSERVWFLIKDSINTKKSTVHFKESQVILQLWLPIFYIQFQQFYMRPYLDWVQDFWNPERERERNSVWALR